MLCVPGEEAPCHRRDLFKFEAVLQEFKPQGLEISQEAYIRLMLSALVNPTEQMVENSFKSVLAAVAYVNLESELTVVQPAFTQTTFPNKQVENGLRAAYHFAHMQDKVQQELSIVCVRLVSQLQHRLYAVVEAVVSIRARFRHLEEVSRAPLNQRDRLIAQFEALTKEINAGTLPARAFGALVAFLVAGVKGLLVFPKSPSVYGSLKVSYFLSLIHQHHANRPIKEPIWRNTQSFILDLIERSLFPRGFADAQACLGNSVNDDEWAPQDCSKIMVSKVIQMDLAEFCRSREIHSGGVPYTNPPYDLPQCSVNNPPKGPDKGKGKAQVQGDETGNENANGKGKEKANGKGKGKGNGPSTSTQ